VATGRIRDAQAAVGYPEAVGFTLLANTRGREPMAAHPDDDASRVAVDQLATSSHCRVQCSLVAFFEHRIGQPTELSMTKTSSPKPAS
jgi:hypothetical protein